MSDKPIPEGYWRNARGGLDPIETIKPIDRARDELVRELIEGAKALSGDVSRYRAKALGDIASFVQLSAEQYDARLGGTKGNVTLVSYDGRYKVLRAIAETLSFDERLQAAKALIEECLTEWTQGARPELRAIVRERLLDKPALEWERLLSRQHVPAAKVRTVPEILAEGHIATRGTLQTVADTRTGAPLAVPSIGFKWNGAAIGPAFGPPRLGEHTDQVLRALNLEPGQPRDREID